MAVTTPLSSEGMAGATSAPVIPIRSPLAPDGEPRVTVLVAGYLSYDKYHPEWGQRSAQSSVTLAQVAGRTILVDTGQEDDQLLARLRAAGVAPEEVDTVVITHTHGDHYKSLRVVPNAAVYASGPEHHAWRSRGGPDKEVLGKLVPVATGIAPGVRLLHTPGHTTGSATVLVAQAGQIVAIAGDAVDSRDFFLRREPSHNTLDPAAERRNFELLAAIADVVVPGHGRPFRLAHGAADEEL
jgi:glyoxylase-like metal-dependent hydrolase (beta-lactamase superfamily II)